MVQEHRILARLGTLFIAILSLVKFLGKFLVSLLHVPEAYFRNIIWATVARYITFFYGFGGTGANAFRTFSSLGLLKNRPVLTQS